jgi:predicted Fe-S protein YdhL (DUF1289 family)
MSMSMLTATTPAPVPSPCISVCRMDAQGLCEGCLRTLDEIAAWSTLDDEAKRVVWLRIEQRQARQFSASASPAR